eukprot:Em0006g982a
MDDTSGSEAESLFVGRNEVSQSLLVQVATVVLLAFVFSGGLAIAYFTKPASKGVTAQFMTPAFPSKTFPNHFTIVTGLYPESHGIVNNNFYDKTLKASFALGGSTQNDAKWWLGEPITFVRPQMMAMYFDEPDGAGHSYGPASSQVHAAIGNVDAIIESLFVGLQQRGIEDCVNVMIVSDHGMTALDKKKVAYISDYLPSQYAQGATYPSYGVNAEINLSNQGSLVAAFNALNQSATAANAPFKAYLRTNIPSRYHSGTINQQRFGDIYLIGDLGSYIYPTKSYSPTSYLGNHGYDNQLTDMQSIFVASGPAFKQGYVHPGFENIELYNLMCGLLGIVPSPNNGTAGSLNAMLKMQ